jgi:hypothetical protein
VVMVVSDMLGCEDCVWLCVEVFQWWWKSHQHFVAARKPRLGWGMGRL